MLIAHFVGDHAKDTLLTRAGWWLTRLAQKGPYDNVTHMEAIHELHEDGSVTIASAEPTAYPAAEVIPNSVARINPP